VGLVVDPLQSTPRASPISGETERRIGNQRDDEEGGQQCELEHHVTAWPEAKKRKTRWGSPLRALGGAKDKLNSEINAALADPKVKARLEDLGAMVVAGSPSEFARFMAEETEKWARVIRAANIKAD
jgi:hypothetical protein